MQPIINTMLDPIVNFGKVTVSTGYDNVETSIVLNVGHGSKLPNPSIDGSFNLVWYDSSTYASAADDPDVEIVRCIARTGDTLVIMRAQEDTSASNKNTPTRTYKMILSPTKKTITDIKTEYQSGVSTHSALSTGIHGVGADTVDSIGARNSAISTHAGITSSVHGFDASGNASAQIHGISKHTGNIGAEANITFSTTVGHAHTGTDSTKVDHVNLDSKGTNTHAQIDTALTASAGHIVAVAPHSGHETPSGAQAKVDTHSALSTGVHGVSGSYVESTAGSQSKVDTHANLTTAHGSTSAATASTIMQRDTNGRAKVATPSDIDDIARKDTVDTVQTNLNTHTSAITAHGATGAIVGTTDSQTLTNKIITDSTNNIMAKSLKSATTTIDVSNATAPSTGQVLTATSSTVATWQNPSVSSPISYLNTVKSAGINYQNGNRYRIVSGLFFYKKVTAGAGVLLYGEIGPTSPPGTTVTRLGNMTMDASGEFVYSTFIFFVPPNYYYHVVLSDSSGANLLTITRWDEADL